MPSQISLFVDWGTLMFLEQITQLESSDSGALPSFVQCFYPYKNILQTSQGQGKGEGSVSQKDLERETSLDPCCLSDVIWCWELNSLFILDLTSVSWAVHASLTGRNGGREKVLYGSIILFCAAIYVHAICKLLCISICQITKCKCKPVKLQTPEYQPKLSFICYHIALPMYK